MRGRNSLLRYRSPTATWSPNGRCPQVGQRAFQVTTRRTLGRRMLHKPPRRGSKRPHKRTSIHCLRHPSPAVGRGHYKAGRLLQVTPALLRTIRCVSPTPTASYSRIAMRRPTRPQEHHTSFSSCLSTVCLSGGRSTYRTMRYVGMGRKTGLTQTGFPRVRLAVFTWIRGTWWLRPSTESTSSLRASRARWMG